NLNSRQSPAFNRQSETMKHSLPYSILQLFNHTFAHSLIHSFTHSLIPHYSTIQLFNSSILSQSKRMALMGLMRAMIIVGSINTTVTTTKVRMFSSSTISQCQEIGTSLM